jgi:hypothetical protein
MNWIKELDIIYKKLEMNGFDKEMNELADSQLSGGTGGEIFLLVTKRLIGIKKETPEVYSVIKNEVDNILEYGVEIGYLSRKQ